MKSVSCSSIRTVRVTISIQRQFQLFAILAHPANMAAGNANDQGIVGHVFIDYCAGADKGKLANGHAAHDSTVGAEGCALPDSRFSVLVFSIDHGSGVENIGEYHAGAAEDAVLQVDVIVHRDVVLDFAIVADSDVIANENVLPQGDVAANASTTAYMDKMPNSGAVADLGPVVDNGAGVCLIVHVRPALSEKGGRGL